MFKQIAISLKILPWKCLKDVLLVYFHARFGADRHDREGVGLEGEAEVGAEAEVVLHHKDRLQCGGGVRLAGGQEAAKIVVGESRALHVHRGAQDVRGPEGELQQGRVGQEDVCLGRGGSGWV